MLQMLMGYDASLVRYDGSLGDVLVSPKFDGICVATGPGRYRRSKNDAKKNRYVWTYSFTRNGKYIPNDFVRSQLDLLPEGMHGELVALGSDGEVLDFSIGSGRMRKHSGCPSFRFVVFNYFADGSDEFCEKPYSDRMKLAEELLEPYDFAHVVEQTVVADEDELMVQIDYARQLGYEGLVLTYSKAPYIKKRCGKTTAYAMKLKDMRDAEFEVIGVVEEIYHDVATNRKECPELIGKGKGFAASFVCAPAHGFTKPFRAPIATDEAQAREYWLNRNNLVGAKATVKYMAAGNVSRPRLPVCKGVRWDLE